METFACRCGNTLFFRNVDCSVCGRQVAFLPDQQRLSALEAAGDALQPVSPGTRRTPYRLCANYVEHNVCNWAVPAAQEAALCPACRLNRTIPDLSIPENRPLWGRLEQAKHHAIYSLLRLGLPVIDKTTDPERGLAFDFMADKTPESEFTEPLTTQDPVLTGHAEGVITLNIAEADPIARTRIRRHLGEDYRTLLGHFRHEIGHYYWEYLLPGSPRLEEFRRLFGDERADYGEALQAHYAKGVQTEWPEIFISPYASAHPWEDWAECWAHYLHMVDTLETADDFGLHVNDRLVPHRPEQETPVAIAPPGRDFDTMLGDWLRLSVAMNGLNRSMGLEDAYPFVLTEPVQDKLRFVHAVIGEAARQ
ncbi:MAG: putative zinc-binding peptidase [Pseudomonadota bacterium]|nr:putative zinc-binding peptidase [Pseudomonadota bacterium]HJO36654.1 putative zinc-binding peptidase [Gammaproteobacteria bacterium]